MENIPDFSWRIIIDLLKYTDPALYNRIARRMMNYLYKRNIKEVEEVMRKIETSNNYELYSDTQQNQPLPRINQESLEKILGEVFEIADRTLSSQNIVDMIKIWLKQEQSRFLSLASEKRDVSLKEITDAIHRFSRMPNTQKSLSSEERLGIKVALIRRFLSEDLNYINVTKEHTTVADFENILSRTIGPPNGNGKLGGKSAGLFRAWKIIIAAKKDYISLRNVTIPKTWYITSDGIIEFLHFNAMEEMPTVKYRNPSEIRKEHPYIEQLVKNSSLPPEIISGLNFALDDFSDNPLIVRSSSLLEDMQGSAFAGKYKSLFVANQGPKKKRLEDLIDAVLEVYASVFGPDPIEYRKERGLIDFNEEMAIMIQDVVGKKVSNKYFFPAFAGVAFSRNEFRWSPRIKREDGVIRLVSGLGTRAVDRVENDYPLLVSPRQPKIKVNSDFDDILKYSQRNVDVINLKENRFETISFERLVQECGQDFPALSYVASVFKDSYLYTSSGNLFDLTEGQPIITFTKLLDKSPFISEMNDMLHILEDTLGWPVDVEFACDGDVSKIYLLQCRPQSFSAEKMGITVPKDIKKEDILFTANKHIINTGKFEDIEYIVYVDPDGYKSLESYEDLLEIGKIISDLNRKLPKRKFILIGPGRWGSRGDIKLGVRVIYSDINNTSMIIEIARSKQGYVPEPSFGTHFFQDLVEGDIGYLPLYPDEEGIIFKEEFFLNSSNNLSVLLPDEKKYESVVKVLRLSNPLTVVMNSEESLAVGFIIRS